MDCKFSQKSIIKNIPRPIHEANSRIVNNRVKSGYYRPY